MADEREQRIKDITARAEAATPGPWSVAGRPPCVVTDQPNHERFHICWGRDGNIEGQQDNWNDLTLIAHAPDDIRFLLAEVARLRKVEAAAGKAGAALVKVKAAAMLDWRGRAPYEPDRFWGWMCEKREEYAAAHAALTALRDAGVKAKEESHEQG